MPETNIICERCGKPARIQAADGKLCIICWRAVRAEKREERKKDSLNCCFGYKGATKVSDRELQIINEVMEELNKKKGL